MDVGLERSGVQRLANKGEDCCECVRGVRQHSCRFCKFIPAHSSSSSFPSPWVTITTTSPFSSITGPFVPPVSLLPPCFTVITSLVHDHPSSPPLFFFLVFVPPTFSGRVVALEAAEQRNCLLSGVDFSGAPKLPCIDTLSAQARQSGPAPRRPPWSHF